MEYQHKLSASDLILTRVTLVWITATSFAGYGDLFNPIQHIELSKNLENRLTFCKENTHLDALSLASGLAKL